EENTVKKDNPNGNAVTQKSTVPMSAPIVTRSAPIIIGTTLKFVAGEFSNKWETNAEQHDNEWCKEDRFPFISHDSLLLLEIKDSKQRVFKTDLKAIVEMKKDQFLYQEATYPSRTDSKGCDTGQGNFGDNFGEQSNLADMEENATKEAGTVIAMYRGDAILEENLIKGTTQLIDISDISHPKKIETKKDILDYLKTRQGVEWIVYPHTIIKRQAKKEQTIFNCQTEIFSIDVQNNTLAVAYKDANNESKVCVWKDDGKVHQCGQCATEIDNATNPQLSSNGQYLAVAVFDKTERWDLKVGPVAAFPKKPNIKDVALYDITTEKVLYNNSYIWGGQTLFYSQRVQNGQVYTQKPYIITCPDCNTSKALHIPEKIQVCWMDVLLPKGKRKGYGTSKYIRQELKVKNNQPLWLKANNCPRKNELNEYKISSLKWGQVFIVNKKVYLATESLIQSVHTEENAISRILIFEMQ
ncbi:MAG: hypothetical protein KAH77_02215, partial [Thiomargarita sp.]|nr:hypothetical protein [Thiomargarita sp.]